MAKRKQKIEDFDAQLAEFARMMAFDSGDDQVGPSAIGMSA